MTRWEAELLLYRFEHGEAEDTLSAAVEPTRQIMERRDAHTSRMATKQPHDPENQFT